MKHNRSKRSSRPKPSRGLVALRARLSEAEETLRAIKAVEWMRWWLRAKTAPGSP